MSTSRTSCSCVRTAQPTYQLSVVSDDVEMKITHVVRGDDHVSNTPKQILLYRAIGAPEPLFAHVPLILGPDKKRLSKRHGATSVTEYERQGYLPEAMLNFLSLLGWSPGNDDEIFTREALIEAFALEGISGGNAVFNPEKLDWFNQQHIMRLAPDELAMRVKPWLETAGLWTDDYLGDRHAWFFAVLELLRPRAKRLGDFAAQGAVFFSDAIEYDTAAVDKHLRAPGMDAYLDALASAFAALETFDAASSEAALRAMADARGVKAGVLIHAVRVAVTGKTVSPGLFDVLALLGRDRVRARLSAARSFLVTSLPNRSFRFPQLNPLTRGRLDCDWIRFSTRTSASGPRMENIFLSAFYSNSYRLFVAHRLQPECWERTSEEEPGGQGRSWICIDGPEQTARHCEQGRQGGAPERHGSRVDERGSARSGPERRHGESSPQAGAAGTQNTDAGRRPDRRQHAGIDDWRYGESGSDDGDRQSAVVRGGSAPAATLAAAVFERL